MYVIDLKGPAHYISTGRYIKVLEKVKWELIKWEGYQYIEIDHL